MCEVLCYKVVRWKDCIRGLAIICEVLCYNGRFEDYKGLCGRDSFNFLKNEITLIFE